jgi:predicted RNase H-like nuclease (RuvC/YqgF family)
MIITYDELLIRKYRKEIDEYTKEQEKLLHEFNEYQRTIDKLRVWITELEEDTHEHAVKEEIN